MNRWFMIVFAAVAACGGAGAAGDACETDDDCEDGLVCEIGTATDAEGACAATATGDDDDTAAP